MMSTVSECRSLDEAIQIWNKDHSGKQIKPHQYRTVEDIKAASIGTTIFFAYNEKKGWEIRELGYGYRVFAWIAKLIRKCTFLRKIFGYEGTILQKPQKQALVAM